MDPKGEHETSNTDGTAGEEHSAARLRAALAVVVRGSGSNRELEEAACALVAQFRQADLPPEQMLLRIKGFLTEAGLRPTYAASEGEIGREAIAYRDVIAWCIKAYYGKN